MTTAIAYVRISSADVKKHAKVRGQDPKKLTRRELSDLASIGVLRQRQDVVKQAEQLSAELIKIYEDNSVQCIPPSGQRNGLGSDVQGFADLEP